MRKSCAPVLIRRLPACVDTEVVRTLMRELEPFLKSDGPKLVFDLAQVEEMDAAGVDMLLNCMMAVSKRDGDLKLAAPSQRALVILELTQMDRLFEIFESSAEAAASFGVVPVIDNSEIPDGTVRAPLEAANVQEDGDPTQEPVVRRVPKIDSDVA